MNKICLSFSGAPPDFHKSTADLVALGRRHAEMDSSSSLTSQSTADSSSDLQHVPRRSGYCPEDTEDSVDDRDAIGDLLEEAMDSEEEGASTSARAPVPVMVSCLVGWLLVSVCSWDTDLIWSVSQMGHAIYLQPITHLAYITNVLKQPHSTNLGGIYFALTSSFSTGLVNMVY